MKREPHEGATAFASRFKTALARLENLISAERDAARAKRRKKEDPKRRHLGPATPVDTPVESSLEDSSDAGKPPGDDEADQTDPDEESQPPQPEEPHAFESPKGPRSDPGLTSGPRSDPGQPSAAEPKAEPRPPSRPGSHASRSSKKQHDATHTS